MDKQLKILPAKRQKVEAYRTEVRKILKAIGCERAFVTDLSKVRDFAAFWAPEAVGTEEELEVVAQNCRLLSEKLGIPVRAKSRLCTLAKKLREKANNG